MAKAGSGSTRRSRGALLDFIDRVTMLGIQFGGLAFVASVAYLLFGIISGKLGSVATMPLADQQRVIGNVMLLCSAMTIGGIALLVSAAIRFYDEEIVGYLLLMGGAGIYWGLPILLSTSFQQMAVNEAVIPMYILGQIRTVGVAALVISPVFVMYDLWLKLNGVRRSEAKGAKVISKEKEASGLKSRLYLHCWDMPYCRDYLRKYCKAHEQKKPCWRIKSGCYCDESLILRTLKADKGSAPQGFDQRYSEAADMGPIKNLSAAQKRLRCRKCFLYMEHQKQKYRMLSPLVIPLTALFAWMFYTPALAILHRALQAIDKLAGQMSFLPGAKDSFSNQWANATAASGTVEWIFLLCGCLVVTSYLLRGLEYLIFEAQI